MLHLRPPPAAIVSISRLRPLSTTTRTLKAEEEEKEQPTSFLSRLNPFRRQQEHLEEHRALEQEMTKVLAP